MQQQLVITLQTDGKLNLSGPIDDLLFCYGLLELAKDALRHHRATKDLQNVIRPDLGDVATFAGPRKIQ